MKIDLQSIDRESFYVNEHILNGEQAFLVIPKEMGCKWTEENKIYRSSLWNWDGVLISASFPKFVNFGEKPEVFPVPNSLTNCTVVDKLDGSTLIVSKYNGNYIIRTRGTVDASKMEKNGHEIEIFKNTILPQIETIASSVTWNKSFIFEWVSDINKIVISYPDCPQFFLIGAIYHENYNLESQPTLDDIAKSMGWKRPETYKFTDITDLISNVEKWEGREGICLYSHNSQQIHKIKAFQYLKLHAFKSNATYENTVELFFEFGMPTYQEFEAKLIDKFDWECFCMVRGFLSIICDGYKDVLKIVGGMNTFVEKLKSLPNRKEQALATFSSYGKETNRSSYIFTLLDGKSLDKDQLKKLLYQVTKN